MTVSFLEIAQVEFERAVTYYNAESPGLGHEFADELYRTIDRIRARPLAWQRLSPNVRRCIARRFPYGVLYALRDEEILIVAIMHLHRNPDSWKGRGSS